MAVDEAALLPRKLQQRKQFRPSLEIAFVLALSLAAVTALILILSSAQGPPQPTTHKQQFYEWSRNNVSSLSTQRQKSQPSPSPMDQNRNNDSTITANSTADVNPTNTSTIPGHDLDHPLSKLKWPRPIFVPSLPKSGTTSLHRYFVCGGIWAAHTFCNTPDKRQPRIGQCIKDNLDYHHRNSTNNNTPPFHRCGNYHVWSDAGWPQGCFYPSLELEALQAMVTAYGGHNGTGLTFLYVRRNATKWVQSIRNWKQGQLMRRWSRCPKFPSYRHTTNATAVTDAAWIQFYEDHAAQLRAFAANQTGLTFVELNLDDAQQNVTELLERHTGIDATKCWKHHNSHEKRIRLNPKFRLPPQPAESSSSNASTAAAVR